MIQRGPQSHVFATSQLFKNLSFLWIGSLPLCQQGYSAVPAFPKPFFGVQETSAQTAKDSACSLAAGMVTNMVAWHILAKIPSLRSMEHCNLALVDAAAHPRVTMQVTALAQKHTK